MVNIEGLDRAKVLAALYNASRPQGMGFLHYDPKPMTEDEAKELLKRGTYFDYVQGRVMKVDLSNEKEFNERLYDRYNGEGAAGAALRVIDQLQTFGTTQEGIIGVMHEIGKMDAAEKAIYHADTNTVTAVENGIPTVTLGADELGSQLKEAVKKATGKEPL